MKRKVHIFSYDCNFWHCPLKKDGLVDKRFKVYKAMEKWFQDNKEYIGKPSISCTT